MGAAGQGYAVEAGAVDAEQVIVVVVNVCKL